MILNLYLGEGLAEEIDRYKIGKTYRKKTCQIPNCFFNLCRNKYNLLAIVPARSKSKGIPNKNITYITNIPSSKSFKIFR